ncbi:GMC oxidoreductase [Oceanibium sediminis]|uniref:GMC oxidoreductase n=1 Tax=Oceanibium sediminis TaxID=2026339 RepID=UPI000DD2D032|nr:GMC family oxidoreductase [Oceanibium sediminis]
MNFVSPSETRGPWDLIVIGSGFGSLFLLQAYLRRKPTARILMLEWGHHNSVDWQLEHGVNSDIPPQSTMRLESGKEFDFTIGLGGGTNCWWGLSPRCHPNDFRLRSTYGVGVDWPISVDELMPHYAEAEQTLRLAGPSDIGKKLPGAGRYPQPPHHLSTADRMLKDASPDTIFAVPQAKNSRPTEQGGTCCSNGTCNLCPSKAKFYGIDNFAGIWTHDTLKICTGARVRRLDRQGDTIRSVIFESDGREYQADGDLIVLGANGIHSAFILLQSGIHEGKPGAYLGEKLLALAEIHLDGLKHFDGGTVTPAFDLSDIDGPHRAESGATLYLTENSFNWTGLRLDAPGRFRETLPLAIYVEDILQEENAVVDDGGDLPIIRHAGPSPYARKGLDRALARLPEIFSALPVESVHLRRVMPTIGHIQGSLRMGNDPDTSVCDANQMHHAVRNLLLVGTSVFPTTGWANPSLTASAMSLRVGALV